MATNKRQRQDQAGIPDSRPFINADTAHEESELLDLHVGGKLVRDIVDQVGHDWLSKLSFHHTDEAFEERNRGKVESAARVTAGEFEKKVRERGDFLASDMEPWEAPDPMKELAEQYVPKGFRPKFLSQKNLGGVRGSRGFVPVLKQNGDPVKLANMVLGMMPEDRALTRDRHYREVAATQVKRHAVQQQEEQERMIRASGGAMRPLDTKQSVIGRAGVGTGTPEGDLDYAGNPEAEIGLRQYRGNSQTEI